MGCILYVRGDGMKLKKEIKEAHREHGETSRGGCKGTNRRLEGEVIVGRFEIIDNNIMAENLCVLILTLLLEA